MTNLRISDTIFSTVQGLGCKIKLKNTCLTLILTQIFIAEFFHKIAEFFGRSSGGVSLGSGNTGKVIALTPQKVE